MAYPCVPFNPDWANSGTKFDLKAIYARPNGDLCTLPMRRHYQWAAKGFTYVTLADHNSLAAARVVNPQQYVVGLDLDGKQTPWLVELYLAEQQDRQGQADADLAALVEKHGAETVEAIKGIKLPASVKAKARKVPA